MQDQLNPRERQEQHEKNYLSEFAAKSAETKGRKIHAEPCGLRTEFQKDRDRITHCKAFRRLMHKTQVFVSPEGDHYRTRLTHTLEVAQIARTIARALRLNEDLTEAIALGHDLGHTPFGHTGEDALNSLSPDGFKHNAQSLRVVDCLENNGEGLNLTYEVTDGIINHRSVCFPSTAEGKTVQLSDKIAYMNHDIDDALRAGLLNQSDLPAHVSALLGETSSKRINFLVNNVIDNSRGTSDIRPEPEVKQAMADLRSFLFANLYACQIHLAERKKIQSLLGLLYDHYMKNTGDLPHELLHRKNFGDSDSRIVCDFIAGMTDRYAIKQFNLLFVPAVWEN
ncbi:MAG: deoxyguanosinetriphosphate triphosphohydrolase [Defluviitaleaceae bacterium]|nr:deoxyguanosinetriphosphate triphosphohydrolase [Defluviitaleaceae bacterium]